MRTIITIVMVMLCLGVQGCVTDKRLTPPDSILDPRSE